MRPRCKVGGGGVKLHPQGAYPAGLVGAMMVVQTGKTQDASNKQGGERAALAKPDAARSMSAVATHNRSFGLREASATGFRVQRSIDEQDGNAAIAQAVKRAKSGDQEAIRFLYIRYKDNIYGYVLSMIRDQYEAEDVTQQVFLKLMTVIHKYESRQVPFTAWLLRVARNVAVDHLRRQRPVPCEEVYEPLEQADDSADNSARERRWGLEQALGGLSEEQRDVIVLRHVVGLTPGEIATHMDRSEASIHGLHHRARKALKRELIESDCAPTSRAAA
jgi:RNA polymerase sigma-70 factor (ECF subfamily)